MPGLGIEIIYYFPPPAVPVTEDMLVIQFRIQPDPEGVRLQGDQRAYSEAIPIILCIRSLI